MDIVIIGGDAAGMSAASRAKRNQPNLNITVLEKTTDVSYSACGMPYNIGDSAREIEDLVVRPASVFIEKQGINLLTGHLVDRIDPENKTVAGTNINGMQFKFNYDKLLIATGASPTIPDLPGVDLPGVMPLKSLEDGRKIKSYLTHHEVRRVVIIGMGYIALEMCEAFRRRGIDVAMVKPRTRFLPWMPEEMATVVKTELEENGVRIHTEQAIEKIEYENGAYHVTCSNMVLEGDMVLVAMGVSPNSQMAEQCGIALGPHRAISVDKFMNTSQKDILAAGDCADAYHIVTGQKVWIPLALLASRAGWAAADTMTGKASEVEGITGTAVFKVLDLQVARTGLSKEEAGAAGFDPASVIIQSRSRAHAHPGNTTIWVDMVGDKKTGRLLGAQMVGREGTAHRINAVAVALQNQMSVSRYSQADLAYAPPFGPVWDPTLTAANQLLKQL